MATRCRRAAGEARRYPRGVEGATGPPEKRTRKQAALHIGPQQILFQGLSLNQPESLYFVSYINVFAATDFRNQRKRFGIEREDRRLGCYIIGRTGMGKSSLLVNMALNDAVHNEGFCFIDPHGDAVERLRDSLPASRASDTIYFDPAGQDPPIGLNLLETVGPEHRHLVVSGLISIFTALYGPQYFQHRQVHVLRNTLIALLELDAPQTLVDVYHLLTDWRFRKYVVARIKDPLVKSFWQKEFPKYVFSRGAGIAPLLNPESTEGHRWTA